MRRVFEVRHDSDKYQYFLFLNDDWNWDKFFAPHRVVGAAWTPPTPELDKPRLKKGDFYHFDDYPLILNAHARQVLGTLLEGHAELLPFRFQGEEFYCLNVTRIVDCLDRQRTRWAKIETRHKDPYFDLARLGEAPVFTIPENVVDAYVRETFKEAVEAAGLKGLEFKEVWNETK